jgi:chromosome segregation ATPase
MRDYMRRKRAAQRAKAPGLTSKPVNPSPAPDSAKDARIRELESQLALVEVSVPSLVADWRARMAELEAQHAKHRAAWKASVVELEAELAQARKRIAELERRSEGQLTRRHREERSRPVEFTEVGRLRAEIDKLKSDIFKLKAALQEEPDAAKLRKKVVDQRIEMAALRQNLRKVVKERDKYAEMTKKRFREGSAHATRKTYGIIVKALHSDRAKHTTAAELAEAERLFVALRPLFDEGKPTG